MTDNWDEIERHNRRTNLIVNWLLILGFSALATAAVIFSIARAEGADRVPTSCLPPSIRSALAQAKAACGITVISTYRPGAVIYGTNVQSMHATCRAADFTSKDYRCVYRVLADWRGKLSTDAARIKHVHIDSGRYARFVHGSSARRFASHR